MRSHQRFLSMLYCISFMSMRPSNFSRNLSFQFHAPVCYAKDTLKAFDDFKDKQRSARSIAFWYVKICIFWKCIQYTIYWDKTQMFKKILSDKIHGTKMPSFFLSWAPTAKHKIPLSKTVWDFPFSIPFRFY